MLHPQLGSSLDPWSSWQVDTSEVDDVIGLYEAQAAGVADSEQLAKRLGKLWKKLGAAPRLAALVLEYAKMRRFAVSRSPNPGRRGGPHTGSRIGSAMGRSPTLPVAPSPIDIEDDPLYDRWVDG